MNVQETVCKHMKLYPSLHRTRVYVLAWLFDSYDSKWVDGCLVNTEEPTSSHEPLPYFGTRLNDPESEHDISSVLSARRENSKAQFVLDNAYLLAKDTYSRFKSNHLLGFKGKRFDDMPADVSADWLEAAKELANAVLRHEHWPRSTYMPAEEARYREDAKASKEICTKFLERFKVITPCPLVRASRVAELQREALALGLTLTEADGTPPKTKSY